MSLEDTYRFDLTDYRCELGATDYYAEVDPGGNQI
jgi:hypothetical protein